MVTIKRVYAPADPADGYRVLVDRLWPRGVSREAAAIEEWLRDLAPSDDLRRWYHQHQTQWPEFRERYRRELADPALAATLDDLRERVAAGPVTLVYSSRLETDNNATVLCELLQEG